MTTWVEYHAAAFPDYGVWLATSGQRIAEIVADCDEADLRAVTDDMVRGVIPAPKRYDYETAAGTIRQHALARRHQRRAEEQRRDRAARLLRHADGYETRYDCRHCLDSGHRRVVRWGTPTHCMVTAWERGELDENKPLRLVTIACNCRHGRERVERGQFKPWQEYAESRWCDAPEQIRDKKTGVFDHSPFVAWCEEFRGVKAAANYTHEFDDWNSRRDLA